MFLIVFQMKVENIEYVTLLSVNTTFMPLPCT